MDELQKLKAELAKRDAQIQQLQRELSKFEQIRDLPPLPQEPPPPAPPSVAHRPASPRSLRIRPMSLPPGTILAAPPEHPAPPAPEKEEEHKKHKRKSSKRKGSTGTSPRNRAASAASPEKIRINHLDSSPVVSPRAHYHSNSASETIVGPWSHVHTSSSVPNNIPTSQSGPTLSKRGSISLAAISPALTRTHSSLRTQSLPPEPRNLIISPRVLKPFTPQDLERLAMLQAVIWRHVARKHAKEKVQKQRMMLTFTTNEILTTERKYCESLKLLIKGFKKPMLANPDVISAEEVLFIFANIEDLLAVHVKFLKYMDDLFVSSDVAQIGAPLGSLFLQFAPAMKIYSTYCNNYFIGHATLERAKDRKTFASWLKKAEDVPEMGKLGLADWLIKPVKRVPQYELLLKQVKKNLPKNSPHYQSIRTAKVIIKELAEWINERKKNAENSEKLEAIQASLYGCAPPLRKSGRRVVNESVIIEKKYTDGQSQPHLQQKKVWLFNDCLLLANSNNKFDRLIYLHEANVNTTDTSDELVLAVGGKSYTFIFASEGQKNNWFLELRQLIDALRWQESNSPVTEFLSPGSPPLGRSESAIIESKVQKEGSLFKQGRTGWRERYYSLEQGILFYYKTKPHHSEKKEKGFVNLAHFFIRENDKFSTKKRFVLELYNVRHKGALLAAETKESRAEWINAMRPYTLFGKKKSREQLPPLSLSDKDLIDFGGDDDDSSTATMSPRIDPDELVTMDAMTDERFHWEPSDEADDASSISSFATSQPGSPGILTPPSPVSTMQSTAITPRDLASAFGAMESEGKKRKKHRKKGSRNSEPGSVSNKKIQSATLPANLRPFPLPPEFTNIPPVERLPPPPHSSHSPPSSSGSGGSPPDTKKSRHRGSEDNRRTRKHILRRSLSLSEQDHAKVEFK